METRPIFGSDYEIVWAKNVKEFVVGHVKNYAVDYSTERRIPIKLTQDANFKHRFLCMENSMHGPLICVTKEFMELDINMREAGIWHEVGHVHHNHYMDKDFNYTVNPNQDRLKWLEKDLVAPEEIEADEFSLKWKNRLTVLKFLKYLQETRRALNEESGNAEKEMQLRINAIQDKQLNAIYYFAYGSNLMVNQMKERCPDNTLIGPAIINGFKWFINRRGFANIMPSKDDFVEGIVYKISENDEYNLDLKEGVVNGHYKKRYVDAVFKENTLNCLVYIDPIKTTGVPSKEYIARLLHGKIDSKISEAYYNKYWEPHLVESF